MFLASLNSQALFLYYMCCFTALFFSLVKLALPSVLYLVFVWAMVSNFTGSEYYTGVTTLFLVDLFDLFIN